MKHVLTAIIVAGIMLSGFAAGSAQKAEMTSVATGLDTPAGWADPDGVPVANVVVTDVDEGWSEAESIRGEDFVAVEFTVTNSYTTSIVIRPAGFILVDGIGLPHSNVNPGIGDDLFTDEMNLAAGESADLALVYTLPEGVATAVFHWTPGNGLQVIVDLADASAEEPVVANGLNAPITWSDADENAVATLEVIGVNLNWLDSDGYDGSGYEMSLLEVRYRFTNRSGSSQVIHGSDFSPVDTLGTTISSSGEHVSLADELALQDEIDVADGDTIEFTRIYGLVDDRQLAYVIWSPNQDQPGASPIAFVILADEDVIPATPVATPVR